jgi:hypothetical protein
MVVLRWALVFVLVAPGVADAGPLGKVVGGMHEAADEDEDRNTGRGDGGGAENSDRDDSSSSSSFAEDDCCGGSSSPGEGSWVTFHRGPPPGGTRPGTLDAYVGVQSVKDSNGSLSVELRASHGDFAIVGHDTSFWEEPGPGAMETIRLDLWALGAGYRLVNKGDTTIWGEASLAGVNTVPDLQVFGAALGARLEHRIAGEIGVTAGARQYLFEHGIRATELQVGLQISVLRVSYRLVDFNVGPPLSGPEVGIGISF